jgi:hypothetical protein
MTRPVARADLTPLDLRIFLLGLLAELLLTAIAGATAKGGICRMQFDDVKLQDSKILSFIVILEVENHRLQPVRGFSRLMADSLYPRKK